MKNKAGRSADSLPDHRGDCRARCSHGRQSAPAENEKRVQNDVGNGADHLRPHGKFCKSGRLEQAFRADLQIEEQGSYRNNLQVGIGITADRFNPGLRPDKSPGSENPEKGNQKPADETEKNRRAGNTARFLLIAAPESTGYQRAYADPGSGCKPDHYILSRKRKRQGGKAVFRNTGDINAVDHVIKRLYHHRQNHRDCHGHQKSAL